ncbi:MAG TPA: ATP-dependent 6-phosphofructokinase [Lentisphaeria bacterium]|nr:MAG: diphosphate--fructose-6-phosphate 1-phosphotransferase [Lentisphaerae bacterium GWF2_50_93]HCE45100.1 ATP-dependent 6-phosphofructokinase [Lentisphaeria bacterium]
MKKLRPEDFSISRLGKAELNSPLGDAKYLSESATAVYSVHPDSLKNEMNEFGRYLSFERAGPREKIFHDPKKSKAAVLTAGGLCPGLNNVIKGLVGTLMESYGVQEVLGIKYGYRGLNPEFGLSPILLTPENVDDIHSDGGTILGSSRGNQDIGVMVDSLVTMDVNMLFCIGGDGTLRGAHAIAAEVQKRNLKISVIGIPKTIDNDISFMQRTFGVETAIYATHPIITCAHNEAKGAYNGVGLIHVMGRDSGFIAALATLANSVVNYCFVPEVPFKLDGPGGFLEHLRKRLAAKQHAVIIIAEGAGQDLFKDMPVQKDASGNVKHNNIGEYLRGGIVAYGREKNFEVSMKYFDPSYVIRSVDARGTDAVYCLLFSQSAVHAAMMGCTDMVVGYWGNDFTHVPIVLATSERKKIDPDMTLWQSVMQITRQPEFK